MYVSHKAEETTGQKYRTIFRVKEGSGDSYMIDGWVIQKDRVDVFFDESEYNAIHQELLQRREEVAELMRERDELREQLEQRKPTLPREVAEALEKARKWGDEDVELVAWCIPDKGWIEKHESYWSVLHEYGNEKSFFELIDALRYGYTIEDPNAEKLAELLDNLAKIGYEGETAQKIVDTIAPIIFETERR